MTGFRPKRAEQISERRVGIDHQFDASEMVMEASVRNPRPV